VQVVVAGVVGAKVSFSGLACLQLMLESREGKHGDDFLCECVANLRSKLTTIISPPTPTITPLHVIFSRAVHIILPYGALNICHTGGSVVGLGVEILVLISVSAV